MTGYELFCEIRERVDSDDILNAFELLMNDDQLLELAQDLAFEFGLEY